MKDFLSLASRRQSDRAFDTQRPVEKEKLQRILEAACIAPSACNSQPWHFIVVDDPELKNRVADATSNRVLGMNHFTKQAPVHILDQGQEFLPSGYRHNGRSSCAGCRR